MLIHQLFKYLTQFIYYLIFPTDYPNLAMHKDVYLSYLIKGTLMQIWKNVNIFVFA